MVGPVIAMSHFAAENNAKAQRCEGAEVLSSVGWQIFSAHDLRSFFYFAS
jgi:hypothetical protein